MRSIGQGHGWHGNSLYADEYAKTIDTKQLKKQNKKNNNKKPVCMVDAVNDLHGEYSKHCRILRWYVETTWLFISQGC